MTAYLLDHNTKARLHNILADAYNYQTRRFKMPDVNELMALMKVLGELKLNENPDFALANPPEAHFQRVQTKPRNM